jgi:hypothetical protein
VPGYQIERVGPPTSMQLAVSGYSNVPPAQPPTMAAMPMLQCAGVFTLHLDEGWNVTGTPGKFYELTRPREDAALHISVYERRPVPLAAAEPQSLMASFVANLKPDERVQIRVLPESDAQIRAVAACTATDASGKVFAWLIFLILWKSHFLMCSGNGPPGAALLTEAEMLFASIAPTE